VNDSRPEVAQHPTVLRAGHIEPALLETIQARLQAGGELIWQPEGQTTNIFDGPSTLKRAYHDSLGINKIIFAFSDDLLTQSFRMPWWYEWSAVLEPVFQQVGVDPARVVRCLFARMPPDCLIDVHHDTGRWTTKTHRMHIAIFTELEKVSFLCGTVPEAMQRYLFPAGQCLELNNRAKHAVYNGWDQFRVHLIFDWLDDPQQVVPPVIFRDLGPGRGVVQHRRALWYFVSPEQDALPVLPQYETSAALRKSKFNELVKLHPAGLTAAPASELAELILDFDLGELLVSELLDRLRPSWAPVWSAHAEAFKELLAQCLTDNERRFEWLRSCDLSQ
jgi:hypothetical protein